MLQKLKRAENLSRGPMVKTHASTAGDTGSFLVGELNPSCHSQKANNNKNKLIKTERLNLPLNVANRAAPNVIPYTLVFWTRKISTTCWKTDS